MSITSPDWHMAKVDLGKISQSRLEPLQAILETIVESSKRTKELTAVLERAMWEELRGEKNRFQLFRITQSPVEYSPFAPIRR